MQKTTLATLTLGIAILLPGSATAQVGAKADDMFSELKSELALRFFDALKGSAIAGAEVTFEGHTAITDSEGRALFPFPEVPAEKDIKIPAVFKKRGYVTSRVPVHFMVGTVFFNRFSISPALPPGKVRIVLDWNKRPKDLDLHLVKEGRYHISYRKMKKFEDKAFLDRDDRDGHGPETITINRLDANASYTVYVHDYTNRQQPGYRELDTSKAHIRVYDSSSLLVSYVVPAGEGATWKAFTLIKGEISEAGTLQDKPPR